MNSEDLKQTLGGNAAAQSILTSVLSERFPALESAEELSQTVIDKYYEYYLPRRVETDTLPAEGDTTDAGLQYWRRAVLSLCRRNAALKALNDYFAAKAGDLSAATQFKEVTTDKGDTTDTDTQERETESKYNAFGSSTSQTGEINTSKVKAGNLRRDLNNTRTRNYVDGRQWEQVIKDAEALNPPLNSFIESFALILRAPQSDYECYLQACEVWRGANGKDGKDGANGKDGKDGANGKDGKDGANGKDGKDGALTHPAIIQLAPRVTTPGGSAEVVYATFLVDLPQGNELDGLTSQQAITWLSSFLQSRGATGNNPYPATGQLVADFGAVQSAPRDIYGVVGVANYVNVMLEINLDRPRTARPIRGINPSTGSEAGAAQVFVTKLFTEA